MRHLLIILVAMLLTTAAIADVRVTFQEGAPKDRFQIMALNDCISGPAQVTIELAGSAAKLVFDVTERGAGVEVFQPFDLISGGALVTDASPVTDGDTAITLNLLRLPREQLVAFTIDVDDTAGGREITVTGSEILGAHAEIRIKGTVFTGLFDASSKARIAVPSCES